MGIDFKELGQLYVSALEDYADAMAEADDFDLNHMEDPYVVLIVENPQPKDGSDITVLPGLNGTVFNSFVEMYGDDKKVTTMVKVKCADIEKFMSGIGMKVIPQNDIITKKLGRRFQ